MRRVCADCGHLHDIPPESDVCVLCLLARIQQAVAEVVTAYPEVMQAVIEEKK